jgi:hypothetical protein
VTHPLEIALYAAQVVTQRRTRARRSAGLPRGPRSCATAPRSAELSKRESVTLGEFRPDPLAGVSTCVATARRCFAKVACLPRAGP